MIKILKKTKCLLIYFLYVPHLKNFKHVGIYTRIDRRYISIVGAEHIQIGNHCSIGAHLRIEAISEYIGHYNPTLIIEDNVVINQNFHCTCASFIKIGKGTSITANCGVFDIIHPYDNIYNNPREEEIQTCPIIIGENCLIGMNSVILPGVTFGNHVVVGANSTVKKGIYPSNCVLAGSPAKIVKIFDVQNNCWKNI